MFNTSRDPFGGAFVRVVVTVVLAGCALLAVPVVANAATLYLNPVKASNGFKLQIIGSKTYVDAAFTHDKRGSATYSSLDNKFTAKKVTTKIKSIGTVDLKYKKAGKAKKIKVPKGCVGKPGKKRPVIARGKINLRADGGFSKVKIGKKRELKGFLRSEPKISSCGSEGWEFDHASLRISGVLAGDVFNWHYVDFYASLDVAPGAKASHVAMSAENHNNKFVVFRHVGVHNRPASTFQFDIPPTGATVAPGAKPFSGSASTGELMYSVPTGDLTVDLPGLKDLPLTGPPYMSWLDYFEASAAFASRDRGPVADLAQRVIERDSLIGQ